MSKVPEASRRLEPKQRNRLVMRVNFPRLEVESSLLERTHCLLDCFEGFHESSEKGTRISKEAARYGSALHTSYIRGKMDIITLQLSNFWGMKY